MNCLCFSLGVEQQRQTERVVLTDQCSAGRVERSSRYSTEGERKRRREGENHCCWPTGCLLSSASDSACVCVCFVCVQHPSLHSTAHQGLCNSFHLQLEIIEIPMQAQPQWNHTFVFHEQEQRRPFSHQPKYTDLCLRSI